MNKSDVYIAKMVLTYLAIICKSRKHNMVQWYGDGGGGGKEHTDPCLREVCQRQHNGSDLWGVFQRHTQDWWFSIVNCEEYSNVTPKTGGSALWGAGWWLKCCFTSTKTVGLLGPGVQDVHLDFLWALMWGIPTSHNSGSDVWANVTPYCSRPVVGLDSYGRARA